MNWPEPAYGYYAPPPPSPPPTSTEQAAEALGWARKAIAEGHYDRAQAHALFAIGHLLTEHLRLTREPSSQS